MDLTETQSRPLTIMIPYDDAWIVHTPFVSTRPEILIIFDIMNTPRQTLWLIFSIVALQGCGRINQTCLPVAIDSESQIWHSIPQAVSVIGLGEFMHLSDEVQLQKNHLITNALSTGRLRFIFLESAASQNYDVDSFVSNQKKLASIYSLYGVNRTREKWTLMKLIRDYNSHKNAIINVIGVDPQDFDELARAKLSMDLADITLLDSIDQTSLRELVARRQLGNATEQSRLLSIYNAEIFLQWSVLKRLSKSAFLRFRDSCMAANILWWLNHVPADSNYISFFDAHNYHVSRGINSTGHFLSAALANRYFALAITGLVLKVKDESGEIRFDSPEPSSIESYLLSAGLQHPLLVVDRDCDRNRINSARQIGYKMIPRFSPFRWQDFDVIIGIDTVGLTKP